MKEIFLVAILCLASWTKALPSSGTVDPIKLYKPMAPRDLNYDSSFGWFDTNKNVGETLNPSIKIASEIQDSKTESVQSLLRVLEAESKHADNEKKKTILSLIQDFEKVLLYNPARYAKILLNNVWHTVDMGAFGTTQRLRQAMSAETFIERLSDLLWEILKLFHDYFSQEVVRPKSENNGNSDPSGPGNGGSGSSSGSPTSMPGSQELKGSDSGSGTLDSKSDESNGNSGPGLSEDSSRGSGASGSAQSGSTESPRDIDSEPDSEPSASSSGSKHSSRSGSDGGEPGSDDGEPGSDSGEPRSDGGEPGSDGGEPGSDSGEPGSDGGKPGSGSDSGELSESEKSSGDATGSGSHFGGASESVIPDNSGEPSSENTNDDPVHSNEQEAYSNTNKPCPPQVKMSP